MLGANAMTPAAASPDARPSRTFSWRRLPDLPPNRTTWHPELAVDEPYWKQLGQAAAVAGAHGDYLIVAGGANFPEVARTATRANVLGKVYWNDIFVMRRHTDGRFEWLDVDASLPDSIAYAATVNTADGVLVAGGEGFRGGPNGTGQASLEIFADVNLVTFDPESEEIVRHELPALPRPMSYAVSGLIGDVVYVAQGPDAYRLDLTRPDRGWEELPPMPGQARNVAVGAAQGGRFFVISGRSQQPDAGWTFHTDAYAYDPATNRWTRIADLPWCVTAGAAFAVGRNEILVVGGDRDIDRWNLIEHHSALRNGAPAGSDEWHHHNDIVTWLFDHHSGFNTDLLVYDMRRDVWRTAGHFPGPVPVTSPAVRWRGDLVMVSGEVGPGIRTPRMWLATSPSGPIPNDHAG
jgi:N-acetylneuraminic acid mutarotase